MLMMEVLSAGIIVLAFIWMGFLILWLIRLADDWLRILSLGFPLGAGVFAFILFVTSWAGISITAWSVISIYLLVSAAIILFGMKNGQQVKFPSIKSLSSNLSIQQGVWVLWLLIGVLFLLLVLISLGRSYASWDGAGQWAVKGYAIALLGSVKATTTWGMWGASYPLNIMLQISLFRLFGFELIPASKVIYPLYFIAGIFGIYRYWKVHNVPRIIALLAILFIGSNPVMFYQSTNGYANAIFAFLLIMAITSIIDGVLEEDGREQLLGGLLLGLVTWTRPEGIAFSLALIVTIAVGCRLIGQGRISFFSLAVPIIIASTWIFFSYRMGAADQLGNSINAGSASLKMMKEILSGHPHLSVLGYMTTIFIQRAAALENWGTFLPILLVGSILGIIELRQRPDPSKLFLAFSSLMILIVTVGIYYVISFDPYIDFELIMRGDFDRAFLTAFLALVFTIVSFWGEQKKGGLIVETGQAFTSISKEGISHKS